MTILMLEFQMIQQLLALIILVGLVSAQYTGSGPARPDAGMV